jgi:surface antigen
LEAIVKKPIHAALICLLGAGTALADPPSQAPAHGWRAKHDPYYTGYSGKQYKADYGILSGSCNRDAIGAVLGGASGAVIGGQVAGKDDQAVGMVIGAVLGAVLGHAIGEELDKNDRACMGQALELGKAGVPVVWGHDAHRFHFTPGGNAAGGCRYATLVMDNHKPKQVTACPNRQGEWKFEKR